jgi:tetratricopeptide (TPR) repeat protein
MNRLVALAFIATVSTSTAHALPPLAEPATIPPSRGDKRSVTEKPIDTYEQVPYRTRLALTRADEKREKGDLGAAIDHLRKFASDHPKDDHFILRNQIALWLVQAGRGEEALAQYQAAVHLERRFTQGWLGIGEIAYNLGHYEVAADALRHAFELSDPKQTNTLYYAAAAYVTAKQPAKAVPLLEDLVSGRYGPPALEWYRALVAAYAELKDVARGRKTVDALLTHRKDDPDAWYLAFQYYTEIGDYEQAAVALTVADYVHPLKRKPIVQLGDMYSAIKVPALAGEYYQRALRDSGGTVQEYEKLASAHVAAYDFDAAKRAIDDGLKLESTYRLWSLLGDVHFIQMDYAQALDAYRECSTRDSTQGRPYLMMGYCALQSGQRTQAVSCLERAEKFPDLKQTAETLLKKARLATATP